jgi:hypothetical protein
MRSALQRERARKAESRRRVKENGRGNPKMEQTAIVAMTDSQQGGASLLGVLVRIVS